MGICRFGGLPDSARLPSAVCVLGPAMRRGELEKAEGNKGIRVTGEGEGNKGTGETRLSLLLSVIVFYHFFIFFSLG
jgi:hypothetical protein